MTLTPESWTWHGADLEAASQLRLAPDQPTVWRATLTDDANALARLTSLLSAEERVRLARIRLSPDRRRFLVGRGLLRSFLGVCLNVPAECVQFRYGPFGKLYLTARAGPAAFQFNVSHSGNLVLLAFHPSEEVGVDVEAVRQELEWEKIASRMFPAEEYRHLIRLAPEEGRTAFFQSWTRHEACLKAAGCGFREESEGIPTERLTLLDLALPPGYQGTVAYFR